MENQKHVGRSAVCEIESISTLDGPHIGNLMKRLIISAPNVAEFEDVPIPECPVDGILVCASATTFSTGTEIRTYLGTSVDPEGRFLYPSRVPLKFPYETGYSMVGQVIDVGSSTRGFSVGDRVFIGESHKEYAVSETDSAFNLPDSVGTEQAVFLNILSVGQLALRKALPRPGENVAIIGLGVIGLSTLAFCRAFGFRTLAIDKDPKRLAIGNAMGADVTAEADSEELHSIVMKWSDGRGADVVIEAATSWSAIKTGMDIVRPQGTVVVVATHTDKPNFSPVSYPYNVKEVILMTSYGYDLQDERWNRKACMALSIDLISRGELDISPMLTHEIKWHDIPEIYQRIGNGEKGIVGTLVHWN